MVRFFQRLLAFFSPSAVQETELLEQRFVELDARFEIVKERAGEALGDNALVREIETRLGGERTWRQGQHVEQLLVALLDEAELVVERARLEQLTPGYEEIAAAVVAENTTQAGRDSLGLERALVLRLLQDRHWHFETERLEAFYRRSVRRRVSLAFAIAVFAFFGPNLLPAVFEAMLGFAGDVKKLLLYTAITAGMLGACFSMLTNLEERIEAADLDGLRSLSTPSYLFFRLFAGAAGGLVLFYVVHSNLVAGALLPDLSDFDAVSQRDKSLLTVLCFAAGFSEKLIASVLTRARSSVET